MSEVDSTVSVTQSPERKISTRKTNKPLMEKRRRARINSCLTELKSLVLQAVKKDNPQYSKLEKADILEMTVQHLRNLQRQHVTSAVTCDPNVTTKYRAGFNECTNEVMRYLQGSQNVNDDVRSRVLNHLADCLPNSPGHKSETVTMNTTPSHNIAATTQVPVVHPAFLATAPTITGNNQIASIAVNLSPNSTDPNNNKININSTSAPSFQSISGAVQLIPGTLPSGQVALFLASPPASATPSIAQAVPLYAAASPSTSGSLTSIAMTTANTPSLAFTDKSASALGHIMYTNNSSFSNALFTNKPLLISDDKMWRPW